jgi:3-oxoacyl-[acyl-carrier protein] reductase
MQVKKALVTGVSRGLGKEICIILHRLGYHVYGISRTAQTMLDKELNQAINTYYQLDLSDREAVGKFVNTLHGPFDLLVLNAADRKFKPFIEFGTDELEKFINSSLTNQLIILNKVMRDMHQNDKGHIIVISSKSGIKGYSTGSLYCGVKGAWVTIHESISRELKGTGVKLLTIIPDSFNDIDGNKTDFYQINIQYISDILFNLEKHERSKIILSVTPKTRIMIFLEYLKKSLYI